MWSVWGGLVIITLALYLYRSRLERDEEDQIFLDDSFEQEKTAQEVIVAKVGKLQPMMRLFLWLLAAATLWVIVYYIWDIATQFK
jgi:cell division protein FtsL